MTGEILFPEFAGIYGDVGNMILFKQCCKSMKFVETSFSETPLFVKEDVDFIYLGSMSEPKQVLTVNKLKPYKERIKELMDKGTVFLITGNALEIFGDYIEDKDGRTEGLGLFHFHAERDYEKRVNFIMLSEFEGMKIIGVQSQFCQVKGIEDNHFLTMIKGMGDYKGSKFEGIHYKNFFATYTLGPLLVQNPDFTRYLMNLLGLKDELVFEEALYDAYKERLRKLEHPDAPVDLGLHGF